MRYTILLLALLMSIIAPAQSSQPVKKKVAVNVTGDDVDKDFKKVVTAKLISAVSSSRDYVVTERNDDFLSEVEKERERMMSGEIREKDIVKIGQEYGAKYVLVADVAEVFDEYFIAARLINVETTMVESASEVNGQAETASQVIELSQKLANALLKNQGVGRNAAITKVTNNGQTQTFNVNGVVFEMVYVPGRTFMMGSNDSDAYGNERPVHQEYVGDFYIGKTEVTQALWQAVMGSNPSYFRGPQLPVERVSWNDCRQFIDRLNQLTGQNFRLPTEVEWEYAARGGQKSYGYRYSGGDNINAVGWYDGNSSNQTHNVGMKMPNELGIYDMSGNVWEWTSDLWSNDYSLPRNGGSNGSSRVSRGGSWYNIPRGCRAAIRRDDSPGYSNFTLGLRLAL